MHLRAQARGKFPIITPKLESENMHKRGRYSAKKEDNSRGRGVRQASGKKWVFIWALRYTGSGPTEI